MAAPNLIQVVVHSYCGVMKKWFSTTKVVSQLRLLELEALDTNEENTAADTSVPGVSHLACTDVNFC